MTVYDSTVVQVTNLTDHSVSYNLPELNVVRRFAPFETKKLNIGELRALNYQRGGRILLREYLSVKNEDFRKELGIPNDAIEYDYTQTDIDRILLEEPNEVLEDTLEFGPIGIIELIQSRAVKLKIPDFSKREIIKQFSNVDINKQITLQEQQEEAMKLDGYNTPMDNVEVTVKPRRRRVPVEK